MIRLYPIWSTAARDADAGARVFAPHSRPLPLKRGPPRAFRVGRLQNEKPAGLLNKDGGGLDRLGGPGRRLGGAAWLEKGAECEHSAAWFLAERRMPSKPEWVVGIEVPPWAKPQILLGGW